MMCLLRTEGRFGSINPSGIDFYNKLIDLLLLKGIDCDHVLYLDIDILYFFHTEFCCSALGYVPAGT